MVLEVLSKIIKKAEMGYISGFFVGDGSVSVSHLEFADDTMIFCEAVSRKLGTRDVSSGVLRWFRV